MKYYKCPVDNLFSIFRFRYEDDMKFYTAGDLITDRDEMKLYFLLDTNGCFDDNSLYGRYVLHRYLQFDRDTDMAEALSYLIMKINSLLSDDSRKKEDLRFYDLMKSVEKDLDDDPEKIRPLARQILPWIAEELYRFGEENKNKDSTGPEYRDCRASLGIIDAMCGRIFEKERTSICSPAEMKAYLDEYVIGQDSAKKTLATAVYGHCKRVKNPGMKFLSDSVLLIGPSGCGKTEMVRRLAEITDCPFITTDISSLGEGQIGNCMKKEDLLLKLYREAGGDLIKAQKGIIFMDEFDKLLVPSYEKHGRDTHAEVQGQLLTMIEGGQFEIFTDDEDWKIFDTSGILFILAGAFEGIEEYIRGSKKKKDNSSGVGFGVSLEKEMDVSVSTENVTHDVLMDFGMKRELAGRIGSVAVLDPLGREELKRILTDPKDSILEKYIRELKLYNGSRLVLENDTIDEIIDRTLEYGVGARGLDIVLRKIMTEVLFEAPELKYVCEVRMKSKKNGIEPCYVHRIPQLQTQRG